MFISNENKQMNIKIENEEREKNCIETSREIVEQSLSSRLFRKTFWINFISLSGTI